MSKADAAYMAGIMDGEGSISGVSKTGAAGTPQLRINVGNTQEALVLAIEAVWGGKHWKVESGNPNGRPMYMWQLSGPEPCLHLLRAIRPYLKVKGPQTDLAIEWFEELMPQVRNTRGHLVLTPAQRERRMVVVAELRKLNKRGRLR